LYRLLQASLSGADLDGWIVGIIIAISIGYAALIPDFSIEGSELAAILGFGQAINIVISAA